MQSVPHLPPGIDMKQHTLYVYTDIQIYNIHNNIYIYLFICTISTFFTPRLHTWGKTGASSATCAFAVLTKHVLNSSQRSPDWVELTLELKDLA